MYIVSYPNPDRKPFYYKYMEDLLTTLIRTNEPKHSEFIPLAHYTHRFTRSIFWELEEMIPFSNHWPR